MSRASPALAALLLIACTEEVPSAPAPAPIVAPTRTPTKPPQIVPLHAKRTLRGEAAKTKVEREPKRSRPPAPEREPPPEPEPAQPPEPVP
jgi:hypothetical protein